MRFKRLEPTPQNLPKSTHLFLVCLQERYAKDFLERGIIRFGQPLEWWKLGDKDGKRGDSFEGVYASMKGHDSECYKFLRSLRNNSHSFKKGKHVYFYSDDILQMRAYCMYGLHDTGAHLNAHRSHDHKFHKSGSIPHSYFKGLFDGWTKESYDNSTDGSKPVVLMITPDKFHTLVVNKLHELGVRDDEIMYQPINYIDYYGDAFICVSDKTELFQKHIDFQEQSEVRIVVDTTRDEVKQVFANDGLIELGPIDPKVAFKLNFFFKDMAFELRDGHMVYELPETIRVPIEGPGGLFAALIQMLSDEAIGSPLSIEEIDEELDRIGDDLQKSFSIKYDKSIQAVFYNGEWQSVAPEAVEKMVEHLRIYANERDVVGMRDTIEKIVHFFPMYLDSYVTPNGKSLREIAKALSLLDEKA